MSIDREKKSNEYLWVILVVIFVAIAVAVCMLSLKELWNKTKQHERILKNTCTETAMQSYVKHYVSSKLDE